MWALKKQTGSFVLRKSCSGGRCICFTKPKSYNRFFIQANACLTHDAYEKLHQINAPTFVIGGGKDMVLGGDASGEIAALIPGAKLLMYSQWGHGLYEEAEDFNQRVIDFLVR